MTDESRPLDAAIVAVGSELLTAWRVDTNSLYITGVLNEIGIAVAYKAVVGDQREALAAQIAYALDRHPLLILTGGLGPTDDDLTRDVVAAHFRLTMHEDATIVAAIEKRFAARGWRMPEVNRRQALVPEGAEVLANPHGTAPGLWIARGGSYVALLPGPPREVKPMMDGAVRQRLLPLAGGVRLLRRLIRIAGRGESAVEEIVQPVYSQWLRQSPPIETTILAGVGQVELHVSIRTSDQAAGVTALAAAVAQIQSVMGSDVVSVDGTSLEVVVGEMLKSRGWRIAMGESCTGGLATTRMTDVAGSSAYVDRTIVAYSNDAKIELLGVPASLIEAHGAVSEPVAEAMAKGARERSRVEVGVGITGIAGPSGGSPEKPVGTVCIAVAAPETARVRTLRFPGGREMIRTLSATTAIDMVRRMLLQS